MTCQQWDHITGCCVFELDACEAWAPHWLGMVTHYHGMADTDTEIALSQGLICPVSQPVLTYDLSKVWWMFPHLQSQSFPPSLWLHLPPGSEMWKHQTPATAWSSISLANRGVNALHKYWMLLWAASGSACQDCFVCCLISSLTMISIKIVNIHMLLTVFLPPVEWILTMHGPAPVLAMKLRVWNGVGNSTSDLGMIHVHYCKICQLLTLSLFNFDGSHLCG